MYLQLFLQISNASYFVTQWLFLAFTETNTRHHMDYEYILFEYIYFLFVFCKHMPNVS